jgi:hypothetical protein
MYLAIIEELDRFLNVQPCSLLGFQGEAFYVLRDKWDKEVFVLQGG